MLNVNEVMKSIDFIVKWCIGIGKCHRQYSAHPIMQDTLETYENEPKSNGRASTLINLVAP